MRKSGRRLTVRDLVVAVVAFALSLKIGMIYSRSPAYWKEAGIHGKSSAHYRHLADLLDAEYRPPRVQPGGGPVGESFLPKMLGEERRLAAEGLRKHADYMERLRTKSRRAALLPWLPNTQDPLNF